MSRASRRERGAARERARHVARLRGACSTCCKGASPRHGRRSSDGHPMVRRKKEKEDVPPFLILSSLLRARIMWLESLPGVPHGSSDGRRSSDGREKKEKEEVPPFLILPSPKREGRKGGTLPSGRTHGPRTQRARPCRAARCSLAPTPRSLCRPYLLHLHLLTVLKLSAGGFAVKPRIHVT